MSEDEKGMLAVFGGLAMLGLLLRTKGGIDEQQLAEVALS